MVERHWKGLVKKDNKEDYIHHLTTDTFVSLNKMNGFLGSKLLTKETDEAIEFLVITLWESLESIKEFAGEDINTAVVPDHIEDLFIDYEFYVTHYDVV